jgi:hypothetical protein
MKTFAVEGCNWHTEVQINDELFENEMDMAFEAMTQGVERFINEDERIELVGYDEPALGFFMAAHDSSKKNNSTNKAMCLTEKLLVNGGFYDIATEFESQMHGAIEQEQQDKKNKKKP